MKTAYLIYDLYYNFDTKYPTIGGIQTYIADLSMIFLKERYKVIILQKGKKDMEEEWNGRYVHAFGISSNKNSEYKRILKKYLSNVLKIDDFVVFMTHTLNFPIKHKKTISIQHGIYWDIPYDKPRSSEFVEFFFRNIHSWKEIHKVNCIKHTVAVDYNYLNWYRTQQYFLRSEIHVIPNYSQYETKIVKQNTPPKIIFARRMEKYRGTRVFADVVNKLLENKIKCEVTFAGIGPDLEYLKQKYEKSDNVSFITYQHNESKAIHNQHDIAVVCSIGSEGTSLSLLEAMGCGCAVVATNIGGMTNIVLDGFNGRLVDADAEEIYMAVKELIESPELRKRIAKNGVETVKQAFSKEKWIKEWIKIIGEIENE